MKQASKNLKVGSSSDEFDHGAIETDEREILPILLELLPGAGRNRNRGAARSIHGDMVGLAQHRRTSLINQNQAKEEMKILTLKGLGALTGSYF